MSKSDKSKGGYYEYGGTQLSIQRGCEINCRYCYAKFDAVKRWKRCTAFEWPMPIINQAQVDAKYPEHLDQPVMFPARHDITQLNVSECGTVIKRLLEAGNEVTIVSKPRLCIIKYLAEAFSDYRDKIIFRFTIGSAFDAALKFWEPQGSSFQERLACLQYCFNSGYKTSVSCEPYLDGLVYLVYEAAIGFVNESFWIGRLKNFNSRVDISEISQSDYGQFVKPMLDASTDEAVRVIYDTMKDKPMIQWKDSIRKVMGV